MRKQRLIELIANESMMTNRLGARATTSTNTATGNLENRTRTSIAFSNDAFNKTLTCPTTITTREDVEHQ